MNSLVERLGYRSAAKLVIINCDDLGMSDAINAGVYDALRGGLATSASLMVPGPSARDAVARYRGEDIGVHLTLNAEWERRRWGPLTKAASLAGGDGAFPRDVDVVWRLADTDEVRSECCAQIGRAMDWGLDITHIDSHINVLQSMPRFFGIYLSLAAQFRLPVRLTGPGMTSEPAARDRAARAGVIAPDHTVHLHRMGTKKIIKQAFLGLRPGVTEIYAHPAINTREIRAFADDWPDRVSDHDLLTDGRTIPALVESSGAVLIGYRPLRDLMRQ